MIKEIRSLLEGLGAEAMAYRKRSLPPYQTTCNIESLEAHTRYLKYLEGSTKRLDEVLQRGFSTGDTDGLVRCDEEPGGLQITLEKVAMAKKRWAADQKKEWEERGTTVCTESLKLADRALDKTTEQEAAQKHPDKIK
jgi:hypothetical protein